MGENGGVLTSPWSQTSGLSVAVIPLEYMSYPTYRQVVFCANALTTASGWPPVPARGRWHPGGGCWRQGRDSSRRGAGPPRTEMGRQGRSSGPAASAYQAGDMVHVHLRMASHSRNSKERGRVCPKTEIDLPTARSICHCEHPKGAWQSKSKKARLLRFTRNDDSYLCSGGLKLP